MVDFGYDISNFTDVDPIFGTLQDFRQMADKAHQLGINIVMDFVPNHSSDQHQWFLKSVDKIEPYTDYYIWKDPKGFDENGQPIPPNNWVRLREFYLNVPKFHSVFGDFGTHFGPFGHTINANRSIMDSNLT